MKVNAVLMLLLAVMLGIALIGCDDLLGSDDDSETDQPHVADDDSDTDQPYIAVVSKGETHQFWQQVKAGALAAGAEFDLEISYAGPESESAVSDQVQMMADALAGNPVAIGLAALDTNALRDQIIAARDAGIPIIGFDSGVSDAPEGAVLATAATDNVAAGSVAADNVFEEISDRINEASSSEPVRIVVLNTSNSIPSIVERATGFRDRLMDLIEQETSLSRSDISVVGDAALIGDTSPVEGDLVFLEMAVAESDSVALATGVLDRVSDDSIVALFCTNQGTVEGLLSASNGGSQLKDDNSELVVVGFDAGSNQKNAVAEGVFLGSITQDPYSMGYTVVHLAWKASQDEQVEDTDTGAVFYDSENMNDPDISRLLYD